MTGHSATTATLKRVAVAPRELGRPTLIVLGPGEPRAFPLRGRVVVGREVGADIVIDDQAISRSHVAFRASGDAVQITDLESRNGTFVAGRRVSAHEVSGPTIVRIGETVIRLAWLTEQWEPASTGPLVGGTSMRSVRRRISVVAPTPLPVLVHGETGTGKEVVANSIHAASGRHGPLIAVNCSALPEHLVESELFGHARGAFTGAHQAHRGLFAAAAGGTLFLDEIGDLALGAQAKLLRVLEDGVVRPVGASRGEQIDVRVISATNRDLRAAVDAGRFRADLFARLASVELLLPPLRERPEDLLAIASYLAARAGLTLAPLDADALEALALHPWPMNVRELEIVLRNAMLEGATTISLATLPAHIRGALGDDRLRGGAYGDVDLRSRLEAALRARAGNVRRASTDVGIARSHAYRLLKKWAIDPDSFRAPEGA